MNNILFKNKKINIDKLLSFGFEEKDNEYVYSIDLSNDQLTLTIHITSDSLLHTKIVDKATNEEYVLHKIPSACGEFVGKVKAEYESIINDIAEKCFEPDVFKSEYAKMVINYIKEKYCNEFEYLWKQFPNNAVVRRKDNKKWYAILLVLSKRKLGLNSDEIIDILDLRINFEDLNSIVDNKKYFPGYHMNKKHWFTICLDGSVPIEEIYEWIDKSYEIAENK